MSDPARDLRYARWLLERVMRKHGTPLDTARQLLIHLGGAYEPNEPELFAQLQAESEAQMDFWAQGQEPR